MKVLMKIVLKLKDKIIRQYERICIVVPDGHYNTRSAANSGANGRLHEGLDGMDKRYFSVWATG